MHVLLESSDLSCNKGWRSIREQSTRGGTELGDCKFGHQLWSPAGISAFPLQDGPDEDFRKRRVLFSHKLLLLLAFAFIPKEILIVEPCKATH